MKKKIEGFYEPAWIITPDNQVMTGYVRCPFDKKEANLIINEKNNLDADKVLAFKDILIGLRITSYVSFN